MMRVLLVLTLLAACGGGHGEPEGDASVHEPSPDEDGPSPSLGAEPADGPAPAGSHEPADHGASAPSTAPVRERTPIVLPDDIEGINAVFLPSLGIVPQHVVPSLIATDGSARANERRTGEKKPPMATPEPAAPVAAAPAPVPEVVVVAEGPRLPDIDMRSPLATAHSVMWRLILGVVVLLGIHTLVRRARRRLPKLQDDLLTVQLLSVVGTLLLTAIAVIRALESASPVVAALSLVAIGLTAVVFGARFLPRYLEGLYLMLGPAVRVGDWVSFGDDSGTLAEVGLVRITLVREDGRRFSIPVASLGGARFSVQPRDHSAPVDVIVPSGDRPERIRADMLAAARVSPYRDPDTPVSAVITGDQLRVHFVAWSPDVVELAVRHLRRARTRIETLTPRKTS